MDLTQYMFQHWDILTYLGWKIIFLIPKGNTDTRGVSLLETLWKVVEYIINTRLRSCITFHDVLCGFHAIRGTWMSILDLKLTQIPARINQYPIFLLFLDLRKSYETLDQCRLLTTLEGYGAGPHMCRILAEFWDQQEVATHQNEYHVPHFQTTMGVTQGGLILPTLFNMVFDNVVQNWLSMVLEDKLFTHDGMELAVGQCMWIFYTDDGLVGSQDLEWLQGSLNGLIGLFRQYGLVVNIVKSKSMTCHPGEIWSGISEDSVGRQITGRGSTYKDMLRRQITCP